MVSLHCPGPNPFPAVDPGRQQAIQGDWRGVRWHWGDETYSSSGRPCPRLRSVGPDPGDI